MRVVTITTHDASATAHALARENIARYCTEQRQMPIRPDDITIIKEPSGRPTFYIHGHPDASASLSLSISHSDRYAIAEISDKGMIGIDIETTRVFPDEVHQSFLTEREKQWLERRPAAEKDIYATLFWSFKESYLKALGTGLRIHPACVEIVAGDHGTFEIQSRDRPGRPAAVSLWYTINRRDAYVITKVIIQTDMTIEQNVLRIISEVLHIPPESIGIKDRLITVVQDSLQLFELLIRFEKELGEKIKYADIAKIETVEDIITYARAKQLPLAARYSEAAA